VKSFSVGYLAEDGSSELDQARRVARALDTDHSEVVVTAKDFAAVWCSTLQTTSLRRVPRRAGRSRSCVMRGLRWAPVKAAEKIVRYRSG